MGYVYHELITPGLLLDNPGATKEELAKLRDNVHEGHYSRSKGEEEQEPWDAYHELPYFRGLERLAYEMRIGEVDSRVYREKDSNGVPITPVDFSYDSDDKENPYKVSVNVANRLGKSERLHLGRLEGKPEYKVGDFLEKWWYDEEDFGDEAYSGLLIREILAKRNIAKTRMRKVWNWHDDFKKGYVDFTVLVTRVTQWLFTEEFPSEEEMFIAWPELRPEAKFDFSQPAGVFGLSHGKYGSFSWVNRDDRYFLDPETFNRIPVGLFSRKWKQVENGEYRPEDSPGLGYTDLILTSEAVRQRAWRIFSYRGKDQLDVFLRDFPDSRPRYEKAVVDAETSWNAKLRGLTHTEFLRMRLRV